MRVHKTRMDVATIPTRETQRRIAAHAPVWRALRAWAEDTAPRNRLAELVMILQLVIGAALCFGLIRFIVGAWTLFQKPRAPRDMRRYSDAVSGLRRGTITSHA